jgi:hypothetical protein
MQWDKGSSFAAASAGMYVYVLVCTFMQWDKGSPFAAAFAGIYAYMYASRYVCVYWYLHVYMHTRFPYAVAIHGMCMCMYSCVCM